MSLKVVKKGHYGGYQPSTPVQAKKYLFVEDDGRKFLLLNLSNERAERLTYAKIKVTQYNGKGEEISSTVIEHNSAVKGKSLFSLEEKIALSAGCADFKVRVLTSRYGNYEYNLKGEVSVISYLTNEKEDEYTQAEIEKRAGKSGRTVSVRKLKSPVFVAFMAILLMIAVTAVTYYQLLVYTQNSNAFSLSDIVYEMKTDENGDSYVDITAYNGRARSVTIPAVIEGYEVRGIADGAFRSNPYIRSLTIEGNPDIGIYAFSGLSELTTLKAESVTVFPDSAFENCKKLSSLYLPVAEKIGKLAFSGCEGLKKVDFGEGDTILDIGKNAFARCTGMDEFVAKRYISFNSGAELFKNSSIKSLYLKNLNYTTEGVTAPTTPYTINALFGNTSTISVGDITIEYCQNIPERFLNDSTATSITFLNLPVALKTVPAYAFSNNDKLSQISTPRPFNQISAYAYQNTAITAYDLDEILSIGEGAFKDCKKLKSASLEDNEVITSLGAYAFSGCSSLTSGYIPATIGEIPAHIYDGASSITEVRLAEGLEPSLIPDGAFKSCSALRSVAIPSSVSGIGVEAFAGCSALDGLVIPDSVLSIGMQAFERSGITDLKIPDSVISVGANAFKDMNRLCRITVPFTGGNALNPSMNFVFGDSAPISLETVVLNDDGLTSLADYAFSGMIGVENFDLPDTLTAYGAYAFKDCKALAVAPLDGITSLGIGTFMGCSKLTAVTVPATMTSIPAYLFSGCIGFTEYTVPSYITAIGNNSFDGCSKLAEFNIHDGVTAIYEYALKGTAISTLTVPYSVTRIGAGVVEDCKKLTELNLSRMPISLNSMYGGENKILKAIKEVNLADTVTYLPDFAFAGSPLTSVALPQTLNGIGSYAFSNMSITSLEIPSSVSSVGYGAVMNCEKLTRLTMPIVGESLANICGVGYNGNISKTLKEVVLNGGTSIPYSYFNDCVALRELTLPATLTSIAQHAFVGCYKLFEIHNLSSLNIEKGSSDYGAVAYYALSVNDSADSVLESRESGDFTLLGVDGEWLVADYDGTAQTITIPSAPSGAVSYGVSAYLFKNDYNIQKVTFPSGVKFLGDGVFSGCSSLLEVSLSAISSAQTALPQSFFYCCNSLKSVSLPSHFKAIGNYAFYNCSSLVSITLPSSLTQIGDSAFNSCSSLSSVTLPSGVESVGSSAFMYCTSLKKITPSASLVTIGDNAFYYCSVLEEFKTPSTVTSIGRSAFQNCISLEYFRIPATATIGTGAFYGCSQLYEVDNQSTLSVSCGSSANGSVALNALVVHSDNERKMTTVEDNDCVYKGYNGSYWLIAYTGSSSSLTLDAIKDGNKTVSSYEIRPSVFSYRSSLTTLMLECVSAVGTNAFANCSSLTSVTVKGTALKSIGDDAFRSCSSIKTLKLGNTVESIGNNAFNGCYNITTLVLPSALTEIGNSAFNGCSSLMSVVLPASVSSVGNSAFGSCGKILHVANLSSLTESQLSGSKLYDNAVVKATTYEEGDFVKYEKSSSEIYLRMCDEWFVYYFIASDATTVFLPEKITYGGVDATSYTVLNYSIVPLDNYSSVFVPISVKELKRNAFSYINRYSSVYYEGTEAEWAEISSNLYFGSNIYYYKKCIHSADGDSMRWRYDENNEIVTTDSNLKYTQTKKPTCKEEGEDKYYCSDCDYYYTLPVAMVEHSFDSHEKCEYCENSKIYYSDELFSETAVMDMENEHIFVEDEGVFSSLAGEESSVLFTFNKKVTVYFTLTVEGENAGELTVMLNGSPYYAYHGAGEESLSFTIEEGQTLEFVFTPTGDEDGARITNLCFIEE